MTAATAQHRLRRFLQTREKSWARLGTLFPSFLNKGLQLSDGGNVISKGLPVVFGSCFFEIGEKHLCIVVATAPGQSFEF